MSATVLLDRARELSRGLAQLRFPAPVAHVYDPHVYAWAPYEAYVSRYGASPKRVVLLAGTNNLASDNRACAIAAGIAAIVKTLATAWPELEIVAEAANGDEALDAIDAHLETEIDLSGLHEAR